MVDEAEGSGTPESEGSMRRSPQNQVEPELVAALLFQP